LRPGRRKSRHPPETIEDEVKYYFREHLAGYARLAAVGKSAWHEMHDGKPFDDFPSRSFLAMALTKLRFRSPRPHALELGCGTGPGACFLSERGFRVHGVDLIPEAVAMARSIAHARGLDICFQVADATRLPKGLEPFELVVDSYCLQGIVTDEDRLAVFEGVREYLVPGGYYLVSTAIFDPARFGDGRVAGTVAGRLLHWYGPDLFDAKSEVVYTRLRDDEDRSQWVDAVEILGSPYLPNRRHRTPDSLRREIEAAGFAVHYQDGGHLVCSQLAVAVAG
jgi:SAM-dependent methyltransferase